MEELGLGVRFGEVVVFVLMVDVDGFTSTS